MSQAIPTAIYCRISSDPRHDQLGVRRQEEDCRALCDRLGWSVAAVFVDDDVSAFSGRRRPGYEAMCQALKDRDVKAVAAWHPDRLHRSPRELEDFIGLVEAVRAKVATVQAGEYDLSSPTGRMTARVVGAVARHESEHKGERIRRKMQQNAEAGLPHGGATRPFGYERDGVTIIPAEAKVIRALAKRIIAGETLRSVTVWLNEAGIPTVTGRQWATPTVRGVLTNPRYAGLRAVGKRGRQQVVGEAVWKPILDRSAYEQVRAILLDPARRTNRSARRYLLTGLLRCSECGTVMVSRKRYDQGSPEQRRQGVRAYVCARDPGRAGCGRRRILAEAIEQQLTDLVAEHVATPAFATAFAEAPQADDVVGLELAELEVKDATLAAEWAAGRLSDAAWASARNGLNACRSELSALVRDRVRVPAVLARYVDEPAALVDDWPTLAFERQRAILAAVLEAVVIGAPRLGLSAFKDDRIVEVRWK